MTSARTRTIFWPFALALLALTSTSGAASAPDGGSGPSGGQRRQTVQSDRETRPATKFSLKKAMARGEVWTSLRWAPVECPSGSYWLNSPGLVTKESNYAPDGTPGSVITWQYDQLGNPLSREDVYGADWERFDCSYDARGDLHNGKLVSMTTTSSRFPTRGYRATYNNRDQHETETESSDFDGDGTFDAFYYTRYAYDADGLLIEQVFEADEDADGNIDFRSAASATYDAQHRIQRIVHGYYDFPGGTFTPRNIFSVTFDDALRAAVSTETTDYDGDGVSDVTSRWTTFSDGDGRIAREVYETDWYGRPDDGADGVFEFMMNVRYEYDADGNVLHMQFDMSDESGPWREDQRFTYDSHGRLVRQVVTTDLAPLEISTTTYSRDQRGHVVEQREVDESPWRTTTSVTKNRYDGVGNLLETADSWWANDEPPNTSYRSTYEYAAGRSGQSGGR